MADPAGHPFDLCQKDGVGSVMDLFAVTIDAPDASALGRFYGELTGMDIAYDGPEGAMLAGDGRNVMFQQIGDVHRRRAGPTRPTRSRPTSTWRSATWTPAEAEAVKLGASRLEGGGERFRVFADPAGHPFCFVS